MHRHLVAKVVGAAVLLTALGGGVASAFTAGNTVNQSFAGEGVGVVSGYTVYNVHYTIAQSNTPGLGNDANISGVSFNLDHAATSVGYALYDGGTAVGGGSCTTSGGNLWTCQASVSPDGYAPVYQVTGLDITAVG
ncbi:MAG: hypothetical protein HKL86_10565 [Acidimicrobiaceae bacterium]|nr:hypothetical protein [Acidimicrobiaceae bacterium]